MWRFASGSTPTAAAIAVGVTLAASALAVAAHGSHGQGAGAEAGGRPAAAASSGPLVQAMIVGREGAILSGPRAVTASATTLHVRNRRCRVAAGTPLATLA